MNRLWLDIFRSLARMFPKGEVEYRVQWRGDGLDDARIAAADERRALRRERNLRNVAAGGFRSLTRI